jgi:glutamate formiminotransferase
MTFNRTQDTAQKILNALGLQGQSVSSLKIEMKPDELIAVTAEIWVHDKKQLHQLEEVVTTELRHYELTPIDTEEA